MVYENELISSLGYVDYILHYEFDEDFEGILNFELNKVTEWYTNKEVKNEELYLKGLYCYNERIKLEEHQLDFHSIIELDDYLIVLKRLQQFLYSEIKFKYNGK